MVHSPHHKKIALNSQAWLARTDAREQGLQVLYQYYCVKEKTVLGEFLASHKEIVQPKGRHYLYRICYGVFYGKNLLNYFIQKETDLSLDNLNIINLLILRMAVYELLELQIPAGVIISEYVKLAQHLGPTGGDALVHKILDQVYKTFLITSRLATEQIDEV